MVTQMGQQQQWGAPFSQEDRFKPMPFRIAFSEVVDDEDDFAGAGGTQSIIHPAVSKKVGNTSKIQTK